MNDHSTIFYFVKLVTINQRRTITLQKSHAIVFPKKIIQLYLETLKFLITRSCCSVTKIYSHYTLEQARFKRKFFFDESKIQTECKKYNQKRFL